MGSHQPIRKIVTPEIPDKLYFRIGDVAKLCDVPAYVLRFWETEFKQLKPNKGGTGQRLYRKRDVEMALRIKSLLYDQGYTIPGARQVFLAEGGKAEGAAPAMQFAEIAPAPSLVAAMPAAPRFKNNQLQSIHNELTALLGILTRPVAPFAEESALGPTPVAKVKTMRPRLVLEPRPTPVAVERPKLHLAQPNLFGDAEPAEYSEPVEISE